VRPQGSCTWLVVLLGLAGCMLPQYERPDEKGSAQQLVPSTGGAAGSTRLAPSLSGAGGGIGSPVSNGGMGGTTQDCTGGTTQDCTGGSSPIACAPASLGARDCGCSANACPSGSEHCSSCDTCDWLGSAAHCGTCSNNCEVLAEAGSTSWKCDNGSCAVASCNQGYGDCDANPLNGCEVDLTTNPKYCGGCSVNDACTYPICSNSHCALITHIGILDTADSSSGFWVVPAGAIVGFRIPLVQGDLAVAFGAVVDGSHTLIQGKFRIALYSELDGRPDVLLAKTPDDKPLIEDAGLGTEVVESPPTENPYTILADGNYWLVLWVLQDSGPVYVLRKDWTERFALLSQPAEANQQTWPSGGNWSAQMQQVAPVGPAPSIGFTPYFFMKYWYAGPSSASP